MILDFGAANFTLNYQDLADANHQEGGRCASRIGMQDGQVILGVLPDQGKGRGKAIDSHSSAKSPK
jgi:hypothetical protein